MDHNLDFYVEEWIRAKYERKEFKEENENELHYCSGRFFSIESVKILENSLDILRKRRI